MTTITITNPVTNNLMSIQAVILPLEDGNLYADLKMKVRKKCMNVSSSSYLRRRSSFHTAKDSSVKILGYVKVMHWKGKMKCYDGTIETTKTSIVVFNHYSRIIMDLHVRDPGAGEANVINLVVAGDEEVDMP
jgi:hypothetical protein